MPSVFLTDDFPGIYNYTTLVGGVFLLYWLMGFFKDPLYMKSKRFQVHVHTAFVQLEYSLMHNRKKKYAITVHYIIFHPGPDEILGIFTLYNILILSKQIMIFL